MSRSGFNLLIGWLTEGIGGESVGAGEGFSGEKGKRGERIYSSVGEILYGLENLRKRRGNAAAEEDAEGEDDGDAGVGEEELEGAPALGT